MERKKNNMNIYQNKNDILNIDDNLDNKQIVIGKNKKFYFNDNDNDNDNYNDNDYYYNNNDNKYINYNTDYINDNDIFTKIKSCFKNFIIIYVGMTYYPFINTQIEQNYDYYIDECNYNILNCPSCYNKFEKKVYIMDKKVILCSNCYNNEKVIYFI